MLRLLLALSPSLSLAGKLWVDVCTQPDTKALPFCDKAQPIEARVKDYVSRIPLADKAQMMQNGAKGFDKLHIPPYQWGSEGLHGPLEPCVCTDDNVCKCPTSFPCPSALASAFNVSLYHKIGQADGREARAINNLRNHATQNVYGDGIDYWSPTINMQRDPRWGRNQEVPGEDPMLTGAYATAFVTGLQGEGSAGEDAEHIQIVACCKHFVANSLENWQGHTRHNFDANVSMADLAEYYLPPFRACVMEGKSHGIMCSYNAVNGAPSCANDWLLKQTLRESWKFDGFVTSDCGAIRDECAAEPDGHGYAPTCANASALSIKAGTDVDCGGVYAPGIPAAVAAGVLTEAEVDASFARLTSIQMKLGLFDDDKGAQPYFNLGAEAIDTPEHRQLALEAARQSIVLLKNDEGTLPLAAGGGSVALIGPHFNATDLFLSNYHGSRCVDAATGPGDGKDFGCIPSLLAAVTKANKGGKTTHAQGCSVAGTTGNDVAGAVKVAAAADAIVLAMGIDQSQEREGLDRTVTTLPGEQAELVAQVAALGKPTVLLLLSGGTISLGELKAAVPAIVAAPYGGEMGGVALAEVLFGAASPSGKLAATMYPPEFARQVPLTQMSLTAPPGRTHMFYSGQAEYAFGSGLTYTSWRLEWHGAPPPARWPGSAVAGSAGGAVEASGEDAHEDAPSLAPLAPLALRVRVRNVGARAARQTVLVFVRPAGGVAASSSARPLRQKLVAFDGLDEVAPGDAGVLAFSIKADEALGRADEATGEMRVARGAYELVVRDGANELVHAFVA